MGIPATQARDSVNPPTVSVGDSHRARQLSKTLNCESAAVDLRHALEHSAYVSDIAPGRTYGPGQVKLARATRTLSTAELHTPYRR